MTFFADDDALIKAEADCCGHSPGYQKCISRTRRVRWKFFTYLRRGQGPALHFSHYHTVGANHLGPALRYLSKEPVGAIHESPGKTHVILSEVAVRHEAEGSVSCDAMHRAAFGSRKNGFFDCAACGCSTQNDTKFCTFYASGGTKAPPYGIYRKNP